MTEVRISSLSKRPCAGIDGGDPEPFVLIPFKSTSPRSDSWHRIGRNFACAYIRTYPWPASGWALRSRLLALSSARVALFQPYLAFGRCPGLPESLTFFPTVSPAHTLVRRSGTHAPSSP